MSASFKNCSPQVNRLYKAVENYVRKSGGKVIVIGGIQIQEWPGDGKFKFTVAVKCCGRKPKFSENNP